MLNSTNFKRNKMKNKQMYVITMETGSYDSFSVGVVAVTEDLIQGETYVNKKNALFESMEEKINNIYQKCVNNWRNNNPKPDFKRGEVLSIPKWKGDQKITQEMREQRKILDLKNQEIQNELRKPLQEWLKNIKQFEEDWTKANLSEDEQEVFKIRNENRWYIEEVNYL